MERRKIPNQKQTASVGFFSVGAHCDIPANFLSVFVGFVWVICTREFDGWRMKVRIIYKRNRWKLGEIDLDIPTSNPLVTNLPNQSASIFSSKASSGMRNKRHKQCGSIRALTGELLIFIWLFFCWRETSIEGEIVENSRKVMSSQNISHDDSRMRQQRSLPASKSGSRVSENCWVDALWFSIDFRLTPLAIRTKNLENSSFEWKNQLTRSFVINKLSINQIFALSH